MKQSKFINYFFKDKEDKIVIAQTPNLPLVVWIVSVIFQNITQGDVKVLLEITSFSAIFIWSIMEIFQGVNYFRRILGVLVLIVTLIQPFLLAKYSC